MLTVLGAGRVGTTLAELARRQGIEVALLRRGEPIPDGGGPIVVCTRNDDVAAVLEACPRVDDLVFVQNGALLPWLRERGVGELTQGQLWFAVPAVGASPHAGAPSPFFGRHARFMVTLLQRGGLDARVLDTSDALAVEVGTKLAWLSVYGLLGDLHRETVLASAARADEVRARVEELLPVCAAGLGAAGAADEVVARLQAYSLEVGSWRASVKEWRWRDGWLRAVAVAAAIPMPLHRAACASLGLPD